VTDLTDDEIQAAISNWASERGITVGSLGPQNVPAAAGGVNLGAAARSISSALSSIPTEIGFDQSHGWALLRFGGPTVGLRSGAFRIGARLNWSGAMQLDTSFRGFRFSAGLSAERWQIGLSYRIGPGMPDLSRLSTIFGEGEAALRRAASITAGMDDPISAASAIADEAKPIKRAIDTASRIGRARPGDVSFEISPGLTGRGPSGDPNAPAIGFTGTARLTIVF
jgi:hypothetical protein